MLDLASRLGCADLATGHYARVTDDGLLRVAADPAKDQTYMLSALSPESLAQDAVPAGGADEARGARAGRRGGSSGGRAAGIAGSLLPRRRGQGAVPGAARRPGGRARRDRVVLWRASSAPTTASTTSPSASARASASRPPSRCTSCAPRRPPTASSSARARSWPCAASRSAAPACTAPAARSTPSACATTRAPSPAASPAPRDAGTHRALELELDEPFHGAAPGQSACLLRGDVIVGWATITR